MRDIKKRNYDKRIGHMSWINHDILLNCCLKMLNGEKDFHYHQFEFKFLTLDEAKKFHLILIQLQKFFFKYPKINHILKFSFMINLHLTTVKSCEPEINLLDNVENINSTVHDFYNKLKIRF